MLYPFVGMGDAGEAGDEDAAAELLIWQSAQLAGSKWDDPPPYHWWKGKLERYEGQYRCRKQAAGFIIAHWKKDEMMAGPWGPYSLPAGAEENATCPRWKNGEWCSTWIGIDKKQKDDCTKCRRRGCSSEEQSRGTLAGRVLVQVQCACLMATHGTHSRRHAPACPSPVAFFLSPACAVVVSLGRTIVGLEAYAG